MALVGLRRSETGQNRRISLIEKGCTAVGERGSLLEVGEEIFKAIALALPAE